MVAPFSASSFEIVYSILVYVPYTSFFSRELAIVVFLSTPMYEITVWRLREHFVLQKNKFRGMFDPECLCSKHAARINVCSASSEAKDMALILCLRIVSVEAENCVVGL